MVNSFVIAEGRVDFPRVTRLLWDCREVQEWGRPSWSTHRDGATRASVSTARVGLRRRRTFSRSEPVISGSCDGPDNAPVGARQSARGFGFRGDDDHHQDLEDHAGDDAREERDLGRSLAQFAAFRIASRFFNDSWLSPEGFPASRLSTLMSSSRASQRMPSPRPINLQRSRSMAVPCRSRGNHVRGTLTDRPSLSSTLRASSVTLTASARARQSARGLELRALGSAGMMITIRT